MQRELTLVASHPVHKTDTAGVPAGCRQTAAQRINLTRSMPHRYSYQRQSLLAATLQRPRGRQRCWVRLRLLQNTHVLTFGTAHILDFFCNPQANDLHKRLNKYRSWPLGFSSGRGHLMRALIWSKQNRQHRLKIPGDHVRIQASGRGSRHLDGSVGWGCWGQAQLRLLSKDRPARMESEPANEQHRLGIPD